MPDIFISYAREDRAKAAQAAQQLTALGYDVFFDIDIPPGQTWADFTESKLQASKALVVLWSQSSVSSQWVREEARMGRDQQKLIPVRLDASMAPFGFGELQTADLSAWRGEAQSPEWRRVLGAVEALAGAPTRPAPKSAPIFAAAAAALSQPAAAPDAGGAMPPWKYVQKCFRLYVSGVGRARRSESAWFFAFMFVLSMVSYWFDMGEFGQASVGSVFVWLALAAPSVSVMSRRAHDLGWSGWVGAIGALPSFGMLAGLALSLVPGQVGPNVYGPDPRAA